MIRGQEENLVSLLTRDKQYDSLDKIIRWNGVDVEQSESVSTHTFNVIFWSAIFAHLTFCSEDSDNIITDSELKLMIVNKATFHDFTEIFDHDVNYKVKYNPINGSEIRALLRDYVSSELNRKLSQYDLYDSNFSNFLSFYALDSKEDSPYYIKIVDKFVKIFDWYSCVKFLSREDHRNKRDVAEMYKNCCYNVAWKIKEFIDFCKEKEHKIRINSLIELSNEVKNIMSTL